MSCLTCDMKDGCPDMSMPVSEYCLHNQQPASAILKMQEAGKAPIQELVRTAESFVRALTNADRIRAMSDEELAKLIAENIDCCVCKSIHHAEDDCCPTVSSKACPDMWLDWLREEAKE